MPLIVFLCLCTWIDCHAETLTIDPTKLVVSARAQIGITVGYDPSYHPLAYPDGDVPMASGVCSDVVIRALRAQGVDLQKLVHEDMSQHFALYPKQWELSQPDKNIDHRRVPNLMIFFQRQGWQTTISSKGHDYQPGDIVTWNLRSQGSLPHVGIISDRKNAAGVPLVIHNIGGGTREEDGLFAYTITGHYRLSKRS